MELGAKPARERALREVWIPSQPRSLSASKLILVQVRNSIFDRMSFDTLIDVVSTFLSVSVGQAL